MNKIALLEHDPSDNVITHPTCNNHIKPVVTLSKYVVMCFFKKVIQRLKEEGKIRSILKIDGECGNNEIYISNLFNEKVALILFYVGTPNAVKMMEVLEALGGKVFLTVNGTGVLDKMLTMGHLLIPTR